MPPCVVACETWLHVCKCAPITTSKSTSSSTTPAVEPVLTPPENSPGIAATESQSTSSTTASASDPVYPYESSPIFPETSTESTSSSTSLAITPTTSPQSSSIITATSTQSIPAGTTLATTPTAAPARTSKFLPSEHAALLVGTIFGGLIFICVVVSLCFWGRKKWEKFDRRRQIERLRIQDSLKRTSRWHNDSEDLLPNQDMGEKKEQSDTEKDTGLPLLPKYVFKFEDMPKRHTPLIMNLPPQSHGSQRYTPTKSSRSYSKSSYKRGAEGTKKVRIQPTVMEEDLYPAPLDLTRFQKPVPPLPPAKLAPPRSSSIYPPVTALPPMDTFTTPPMEQKPDAMSPITGKSLVSNTTPTLPRTRRNPIRKSLIPIYFMGNRGEGGNEPPGRLRNSLSQGAAKLVAGPVAIHNALFGSRHSSRHRGNGASANCGRTNSVGTYTTIESTDSVYGSAVGPNRRSTTSRGGKSVRFPVRPVPPLSGPGRGRSTGERLSRLSRASRSSEALPSTLQVRFKTPSLNRKRQQSSSIYSSRAQQVATPHPGSSSNRPPPVPPKSKSGRTSVTRKPVPQQGLRPAGKSVNTNASVGERGALKGGQHAWQSTVRGGQPPEAQEQFHTYFI